jgi:D-alanyl-D-alanine carboxypeptidase-like protein
MSTTTTTFSRAAVLAAALVMTACGGETDPEPRQPPPTGTAASPAQTPSPRTPRTSPTREPFQAQVKEVNRNMVRYSWRPGCPVPLSRLRLIEMTYLGMDHKPHKGQLMVNASASNDIVKVFQELYEQRFPIRRMELVDVYKGDDFDSIEANNTSAFNCRRATGSSSWSQHAYGLALDLNPCENPYVSANGHVAHKNCVKFRDRARRDPGMIRAGGPVVRAFRGIGWEWGGDWSGTRDYQHFSQSGR